MNDADIKSMEELSDKVYTFAGHMIADGHKPFAVAAVFTMVAMQIYKTQLSPGDYDQMIDSISQNRDKVKSLLDMVNNPNLSKFH